MHESDRELKIKKHVENKQPIFDSMVLAAKMLANKFLHNGFDPRETDALPDIRIANEWYPFICSDFYKLYNELIIPISITDTPFPGRAFKLFTASFEIDRNTNEIRFNREQFIDFFNDEIGKRVKGMVFKYTEQNLPEVVEKKQKNISPVIDQPESDNSNKATHGPRKENTFFLNGISMQILSGFMIAIGTAACALSFTALNAASCGLYEVIAASLGAATLLGGLGLFAYSTTSSCQSKNEYDNKATFSSMM